MEEGWRDGRMEGGRVMETRREGITADLSSRSSSDETRGHTFNTAALISPAPSLRSPSLSHSLAPSIPPSHRSSFHTRRE